MPIEEIATHIASLHPNGTGDCCYRNAYGQALIPEAELVFGALVLDLGSVRAAISPHCWLLLDGQIIDFAWSAFSRQFADWNGPVVNMLAGPPIGSDYGYVEQAMDTAQFDPIITEANLDAHDYQGDCRPAVRGAARTAPTLQSAGAGPFQHRARRA